MKWIIFFISLPYCIGINTGPVKDGPNVFVCLEPRGQFRNPNNCSTFYNCWDGSWYIQNCPEGLLFNEANRACDWPGNVNDCNEDNSTPETPIIRGDLIKVKYTIIDRIHQSDPISIILHVPQKTNAFDIMKQAAKKKKNFRFESDLYQWGHYVHKLNGIDASDKDHNYWYLYRAKPIGSDPVKSTQGPDDLFPEDNEEILFIYEGWGF